MKFYAVTIRMKGVNIGSKLKIPLNGYFQLLIQVLIDIFLRKSITAEKSSLSLVNLPSLKVIHF